MSEADKFDRARMDRETIQELRSALDRDYIHVGEVSIWVTLMVVGVAVAHLAANFAAGYFGGAGDGERVKRPQAKANATVWVGRIGATGFALAQVPGDTRATADFIDARLESLYGQKVRSYWLSLYCFAGEGAEGAALDGLRVAATIGGQSVAALPPPTELSPAARLQLDALSAPVALKVGHETRLKVVFPAHDPAKLEALQLAWSGGSVSLAPRQRALKALQDFRRGPTREFFESAHADDGKGEN